MKSFFLSVAIIFTNTVALYADQLSRTEIQELQSNLNRLRYNVGSPDGLVGKKTNAALQKYLAFTNQSYNGVPERRMANSVSDLLDRLAERASNPVKVLPDPTAEQSYPFCNKINLPSVESVISLASSNGNFVTISKPNVFGPSNVNQQELSSYTAREDILDMITWYQAAYWANPDEALGNQLKNLLKQLLLSGFSSKLLGGTVGSDHNMAMKDALLVMMYAYGTLAQNSYIDVDETLFFHREFKDRIEIIQQNNPQRYAMSLCEVGANLFGCQNHTYQHQHIRTLFGHLFDYPEDFQMGEKLFKFAIDDLSEDGALWREAVRSRWSWMYYSHALGHLVSIAELHRLSGKPSILDYKPIDGQHQFHDAVTFLLEAIKEPEQMWEYSKALAGVSHYYDYEDYRSLEHLTKLTSEIEHGGLKNWYYIYRGVAGAHDNIRMADRLIPTFQNQLEYSKHLGYLGQCVYDTRKMLKLNWITEIKDENYAPVLEAVDEITLSVNAQDYKIKHVNKSLTGVLGRETLRYSFEDETIAISGLVLLNENEAIRINIREPVSSHKVVTPFGPGDSLVITW